MRTMALNRSHQRYLEESIAPRVLDILYLYFQIRRADLLFKCHFLEIPRFEVYLGKTVQSVKLCRFLTRQRREHIEPRVSFFFKDRRFENR